MTEDGEIIDRGALRQLKAETGSGFARILSYFREDGAKSIAAIEVAMRARNAAALVIPAHTLKGESLQFGATRLAALAERIEFGARDCVEAHRGPEALGTDVLALRPAFDATLAVLEPPAAATPARPMAPSGRATFGRRTFGTALR